MGCGSSVSKDATPPPPEKGAGDGDGGGGKKPAPPQSGSQAQARPLAVKNLNNNNNKKKQEEEEEEEEEPFSFMNLRSEQNALGGGMNNNTVSASSVERGGTFGRQHRGSTSRETALGISSSKKVTGGNEDDLHEKFETNIKMSSATAAAGGGGKGFADPNKQASVKKHQSSTSSSDSDNSDSDPEQIPFLPPRDPNVENKVKKRLQLSGDGWQFFISSIKAGKQAVAEGNDDPNLTKWSKKYLPGVLDAVVKLQEHVVDFTFEGIFCNLKDVIEIAVHGRSPKRNDDFLSNFRECNELILTVLCVFASLRGGLYFENEQFKDQYKSASQQFEGELLGLKKLLLDCVPAPLDGDWNSEEDAPVPAESKAKNWKEYIETMIALKEKEFVKLRQELIFWSQKLKAVINYVDPCKSQEEKEILQLNNIKISNNNNNNKGSNSKDPTSVEIIRRDLAAYYNEVEFSMSQSSSSASGGEGESGGEQEGEGETAGKFEDFFCNLRLKKRQQQKEGEKQSATEGEFVSASHLPTRLRSAAHTVLVTGPGGAGKTVALKHICIQQGVENSIIIFVPLKELRGMPRRIKSIEDIFENCSASVVLSEEQIEAIIEKRIPVIFAFDGFDEVHNAQEDDKNIAHFLSDMIDPKKRKFSLENKKLAKLVRDCDRVIISSREERIASANCNLDSAEARPLVDELAVQLWTNSEVERFCLRFFSNAFKNQEQEQEQQNQKGEKQEQHLAKAVRTATNDVISSLASPLMDSWRGLPLAVTLLSQLRSSAASENSKNVLDNMSPARAYSLVLEMHWRRNEMRVADRLLRCKKQYIESCRKEHNLDLNNGVTPELFDLVLNSAAEASFKQLLSTNSNVTEISFSSSSSLPLWAALLRETGLIRVENNNSKATFSHRSWIEFLCARHAGTSSTENAIEQIPWDQSKFASVWLLLADFARSRTFEKSLSVQRFSFAVMSKYAEKIKETVKRREGEKRLQYVNFDVDSWGDWASISLLARITNIIKPEELFAPLRLFTPIEVLDFAKKHLDQLPKLIKRKAVSCSKCETHFSEAPADWKCNKCNVLMWNEITWFCHICCETFLPSSWRGRTRCCGKTVCSDCVFEKERVSKSTYFCKTCVAFGVAPVMNQNALEDRKVSVLVEETLDQNDCKSCWSSLRKQTMAANSFTLHLRWLAELCVAEGSLDCFKFIEEKYPEALFGVFEKRDLEFAKSEILSPAAARALDHLDHPSVSACVEYIINKYDVEVQLEDAIRANSLVGVTRAIKKMEKENFSLDAYVKQHVERGRKIMELFSDAIGNRHFDVVAAMLRCRREGEGCFLWCDESLDPQVLHFRLKYLFPQDLQFRVWCEEEKDFETSTLSDLAKLLQIDLSSDMQCEKFEVKLSEAEEHLWIQFFHLFQEVVHHHRSGTFSFTPSNSPGQLRVLGLPHNSNFTDEELGALVGKCTHLEEINLCYTKFTDASLRALATCGSTLRSLNLRWNVSCTDVGLAALVSKCTRLEEINLSGRNTKFTDVSLKALAASPSVTHQKPPTLVKIDLTLNDNFTDAGIDVLKEAYGDFWSHVAVNARFHEKHEK